VWGRERPRHGSEVEALTRFVIDSGAALQLASASIEVSPKHELHAPTLWRSQVLSALYQAVRRGEISRDVARERLAYVNGMKIRLLGDAVLRRRAWEVAEQLRLATTYEAEYIALAQLQKCTLVSTDARLLKRVGDLVPTANVDALS
jgi:predicted nucleic acid-binding protein